MKSMQSSREQYNKKTIMAFLSILIVVAVVIFQQTSGTGAAAKTLVIGTDDTQIGISPQKEDAFAILFSDIQNAELTENPGEYTWVEQTVQEDRVNFGIAEDSEGNEFTVCLDPTLTKFIRITTVDQVYLITSTSDKETQKLYKTIEEKIGE